MLVFIWTEPGWTQRSSHWNIWIFSLKTKAVIFTLAAYSVLKTENPSLLFTEHLKFYRTVSWADPHHVQLDKMAEWIKGTISTFNNPAKDFRGCSQSHADPRVPLWRRGAWATEGEDAWCSGSPLVSEVPKVADHHHHIWAATAWMLVCPDPSRPRRHCALQVFDSYHPILTLACCQKQFTASPQGLTAGKRPTGDVRQDELPGKPLRVTVTDAGEEITAYIVKVKVGML